MLYHWCMNKAAAPLMLTDDQRRTLEAWVRATNTPQGIALRAKIVLAAADGAPNQRIAKELGITRSTVSLWRGRFAEGGTEARLPFSRRAGRSISLGSFGQAWAKTRSCDALIPGEMLHPELRDSA